MQCQHSITVQVPVLDAQFQSHFPITKLGKCWRVPLCLDLGLGPIRPGPFPPIVAIKQVNQWMEDPSLYFPVSVCNSAFQINTYNTYLITTIIILSLFKVCCFKYNNLFHLYVKLYWQISQRKCLYNQQILSHIFY